MVSTAKTCNPNLSKDKEIVIATPEGPSIVSTERDAPDGNVLSGKNQKSGNATNKDDFDKKGKSVLGSEIAEVHLSPAKSLEESSSTGSSTWSVKISPIKKRFSLTSKIKRTTSNEVETKDTESDVKAETVKDEVLSLIVVYSSLVALMGVGLYTRCPHSVVI